MPILEIPDDATNKEKRSIRLANAKTRGTHSKEQWQKLKNFCGSCVRCGSAGYNLERDHIVPLYQGGCDCIENIQPLCARCNASKGHEDIDYRPDGWIESIYGADR